MSMNVIVNKTHAIIMAFFAAVFLLAGLSLITVGSWIGGTVCVLMVLVYLYLCAMYGAVVHIGREGVTRRIPLLPAKHYTWDELQEVGVFGSNILKSGKSGKPGTRYLYFSTNAMTSQERFDMVLKWPVRQIHFAYSPRALEIVQYYWEKPVINFHAGDLS